ncbi:hypothetical protein N0V93_008986 [Gnomoniopsis smithogilvyi]|uniref:CENP-V/GFA domain-containing protein n=1 Tax=Gnomoniopsis smithogilvyi TaxID=1191159 RepID=A0A9W8YJU3_9PEZI|nr:hypothetical protein N0V93_008986 [Gnomoniopsis smithogilvyi]
MVEGGCLCGAIRIKSTGQAIHKALCHCLDCRKITGSTYSTNLVVPTATFTLTKGTPKEYHHTADSGNTVILSFCGDCGSTLWSRSATFGDTTVIKAGTLDEEEMVEGDHHDGGGQQQRQGRLLLLEEEARPLLELFVRGRPSWVAAVKGAVQDEDGAAQKGA